MMKMSQMKIVKLMLVAVMVAAIAAPCLKAESPYTEGTVWSVTFVRTEANRTDDYLSELQGYYKKFMDEAKKEGLIISYKLLLGQSANQDDFDLMLMLEFKNMAAFDGQKEKWGALGEKLFSEEQTDTALENYTKVREIFGSKLMREITLK